MRTLALSTLLSVILVLAGMGAVAASPSHASVCHEDQSCWSWSTMGNHKRGVVTLRGNRKVVGPCGFRRLYEQGHIAYTIRVGDTVYRNMLTRLKGDAWALKHGCGFTGSVQNY